MQRVALMAVTQYALRTATGTTETAEKWRQHLPYAGNGRHYIAFPLSGLQNHCVLWQVTNVEANRHMVP